MFNLEFLFIGFLGAIMASFVNCLAWRLYHGQNLWSRSGCPKCHRQIAWYDNVPLFSYLALAGRCRHCHKKISLQYFVVELAMAMLFLLAWHKYFPMGDLLWQLSYLKFNFFNLKLLARDWLLICILTVIFLMDLKWYVVADAVSLPAIIVIFLINWSLGLPWLNLISSAIIGAGFFGLQYVVSRGRWVGEGDIRLGALLGVMLGWPLTLLALMLAYFSGALVGIGLLVGQKKGLKSAVPFGAFLAPAALVALWWGQIIWHWYLGLLF